MDTIEVSREQMKLLRIFEKKCQEFCSHYLLQTFEESRLELLKLVAICEKLDKLSDKATDEFRKLTGVEEGSDVTVKTLYEANKKLLKEVKALKKKL